MTFHPAINVGDTTGVDITIGTVPFNQARVNRWHVTTRTAGDNTGTNAFTLQAGATSAGVAIATVISGFDADGAAGTTQAADGLPIENNATAAARQLTEGNVLQILNTESGTVTDGPIIDISVFWGS